jgi:hypothetical protein
MLAQGAVVRGELVEREFFGAGAGLEAERR